MLVFIEIEGKVQGILPEILALTQVSEQEVLTIQRNDAVLLLLDIIKATQVINWFLQNSEFFLRIKKALGQDASYFEHCNGFREFIITHLGVREGQKWVIEQMPGEIYIALRRAIASELRAYTMKEDIIDAEPQRIVRVVSIGQDISIESIDFKYAIQYQ
jgi:hypothetical protein